MHNAFNEENRISILWAVRFECPSGARFVFNCCCHCATLVIRAGDGAGHFFFSKERVTQKDPLAMVVYRMGILLRIHEL